MENEEEIKKEIQVLTKKLDALQEKQEDIRKNEKINMIKQVEIPGVDLDIEVWNVIPKEKYINDCADIDFDDDIQDYVKDHVLRLIYDTTIIFDATSDTFRIE